MTCNQNNLKANKQRFYSKLSCMYTNAGIVRFQVTLTDRHILFLLPSKKIRMANAVRGTE
jgi:hypothetical protein